MTNDLSIKVTVACKDGDWTARSPAYSFYGLGESPEDALDDFAAEVRKFYTGAKFAPRDNRPLDAFGIDCSGGEPEEEDEPKLLEGECTLLLEAPRAPEHYALSFDKYFIADLLRDESITAIIVPFNGGQHIKSDDVIWIYERKEMSGAQAFVGIFTVEDALTLHSTELMSTEWEQRHGYLRGDITPGDHVVVTFSRDTVIRFPESVAVPDDEKAPRGCNWLRPAYVQKLKGAAHEKL